MAKINTSPTQISSLLVIGALIVALFTKGKIETPFVQSIVCNRSDDSLRIVRLAKANDSLLRTTRNLRELIAVTVNQNAQYRAKGKLTPLRVSEISNIDPLVSRYDSLCKLWSALNRNPTIDSTQSFWRSTHDVDVSMFPRTLSGGDSLLSWTINVHSNDSVDVDIALSQHLRIVHEQSRIGLFNLGRRHSIHVTSNNPYLATSNSTFAVRNTRSRFGLGLGVGYGAQYNKGALTFNPTVGISLNYNVINFARPWKK